LVRSEIMIRIVAIALLVALIVLLGDFVIGGPGGEVETIAALE